MHTNRLIHEKSPYLLQHAHNPVDWQPWGEEAFHKARTEDKPIFLSIGYSTCHWCHVMERESFESEEIAHLMNRSFVPIKVDREERPDVDRIYMSFVQATTGGGGWPMSVWLTPDLKPFYGGTYFPPDNRYGRPGFGTLLEHIAKSWQSDRARILESSGDITRQLGEMLAAKAPPAVLDESALESCYYALRRSFDPQWGGFGGAPKFPRPVQFDFLFRYYWRTHQQEALDMALVTLREMYKGGMYDQLGGGFHRYSVDARWFVPHFEKMLYDQAQLAIAYLEAYQISQDAFYAQIARETLDYVLRDMTDVRGGFYSAEDADSVIDPADPKHKGEGAFYIWSAQEIDELLRKPESEWFCYRFGVEPGGNVAEDAHGEFTARNIFFQAHTIEETARHFGVSETEVESALAGASAQLMARRGQRVRPHLDDKILAGWNGLMISAFAKGAQALGSRRYLEAAQKAAAFVLSEMTRGDILLRRYREDEAAIPGFLDDYAFFAQGLLDLYEADFEVAHLKQAERLTRKMLELFEDPDGGFYSTATDEEALLMRLKDDYDGAEPSGNSIAILNLLRLEHITRDAAFGDAARRAFRHFAGRLQSAAITLPRMLAAYMFTLARPKQIVIAGDAQAMLAEIRRRFLPHAITLLAGESLAEWLPAVRDMRPVDGKAAAYVCENFTCQLPATDVGELARLLE
ncbi:MAG: thioredoxin domain-containing protein [Acidobacteria bacterium]|nr:thioredoxin domain-containing protein [Acidobacteriota bacterium]